MSSSSIRAEIRSCEQRIRICRQEIEKKYQEIKTLEHYSRERESFHDNAARFFHTRRSAVARYQPYTAKVKVSKGIYSNSAERYSDPGLQTKVDNTKELIYLFDTQIRKRETEITGLEREIQQLQSRISRLERELRRALASESE